ncbi:plasmid transfer protein TraA [Streptomyces sp. NPDC057552]|uniref:plasmid transfer protein TraA n=1 Tax=Streptomyces sp. NPDC057552 TaxID=3350537 RepID=UPI00367D6762
MSTPAEQARAFANHQSEQPFTAPPRPRKAPTNSTHPGGVNNTKTRNGGGFNPKVGLTLNKTIVQGAGTVGATPGAGTGSGTGGKVPGSDFMSNEDIRAFCEHHRRKSRDGATELALDADHLETVLRAIRDPNGTLGGSRARARRVTRWLKKAAAAQKAQQKYFAALYATFESEFDSNLRTVGKARSQQRPTRTFNWQ